MKVAILGGTGNLGKGIALRLCQFFPITLGSRNKDKAKAIADEYTEIAKKYYPEIQKIEGMANKDAVLNADIVTLAVNASALEQFIQSSIEYSWAGKVVICPATKLVMVNKLFEYSYFAVRGKSLSAAEYVQEMLPNAKVVSTLQLVPASRLADLSKELSYDVPVLGDEKASSLAIECLSKIRGLRFLYAGPLHLSAHMEGMLSILLNIARINRLKEPGIKVV
ncbi:MAG: NAD(P)-binding domain-containing protein [Conexivisphaerales archaeon]